MLKVDRLPQPSFTMAYFDFTPSLLVPWLLLLEPDLVGPLEEGDEAFCILQLILAALV